MTEPLSNKNSLELLIIELKTARLKKSLSVDDVSQLTKIKKDYLEKLENGNFSFLPNSYVYACIKAYVKEMGLGDSESLEKCNKDLQVHWPLNKVEIVETGSCHNEKGKWVNIITHSSQLLKSILSLTIGMFVGVLIGIGLSYTDYLTDGPRLPVITARPSVSTVDTSAKKKQHYSKAIITSSVQVKPSPALIHSPVSDVEPAPLHVSGTQE
jgi:cytoskeletal protein RodZ